MQGRMRATPRGLDPERRQKISTAQGKEDANGSVIKTHLLWRRSDSR
jgi:hypothetical protein